MQCCLLKIAPTMHASFLYAAINPQQGHQAVVAWATWLYCSINQSLQACTLPSSVHYIAKRHCTRTQGGCLSLTSEFKAKKLKEAGMRFMLLTRECTLVCSHARGDMEGLLVDAGGVLDQARQIRVINAHPLTIVAQHRHAFSLRRSLNHSHPVQQPLQVDCWNKQASWVGPSERLAKMMKKHESKLGQRLKGYVEAGQHSVYVC